MRLSNSNLRVILNSLNLTELFSLQLVSLFDQMIPRWADLPVKVLLNILLLSLILCPLRISDMSIHHVVVQLSRLQLMQEILHMLIIHLSQDLSLSQLDFLFSSKLGF